MIPALAGVGSSPLTRGKLPPRCQRSAQQRLIPAHAGKTFRRKAGFSDWPAHPRSRGENAWTARGRSTGSGSSPLTRGKRGQGDDDAHTWRLIPAHAGKTLAHDTVNVLPQAHPRSRGENQEAACDVVGAVGSSPLTRGKLQGAKDSWLGNRLIPAHAGKTMQRYPDHSGSAAHPRSRGENTADDALTQQPAGSSPLTRGKPLGSFIRDDADRLIPAHAGKTGAGSPPTSDRRAHPRSRGENVELSTKKALEGGSSPLTRGKRADHRRDGPQQRLIPAHAGKTPGGTPVRQAPAAHPRSRGENQIDTRTPGRFIGSSPLTRGKPLHYAGIFVLIRLIPAHAGKTLPR